MKPIKNNLLNPLGSNRSQARLELYDSIKSVAGLKSGPAKIMAFIYFSALIIAMIVWGPSLILYLAFALLATIFILPDQHLLGLSLIIVLTMVFERYFALQGLQIDKSIYKFYLLDIIICLSWLALFVHYKVNNLSFRKIIGWPETLMFLWLGLVGAYLIRSYFDINADPAVAFSSFKNYFFYPLFYFFIIFAIDSRKKLKDIVHLILLSAIIIIAFIVIGFARGQGLWTEFTPLSTVGTRYLAGTHAYFLALAVALGLPLLVYNRLRNKPFVLAILGFWTLGIAVSLMRHLWLALAVALAGLFFFLNKELKKTYLSFLSQTGLAITAVIATLILSASLFYFFGSMDQINQNLTALYSRIATVADLSADTSATWRQDIWYNAEKIWLANPVFGAGFGHTMLIDNGTYQSFEEIRNIHNSPLAITVQMGLAGITVLVLFAIMVITVSIKKFKTDPDLQPYYSGILGAIIVFAVACLFQPYLETNMMAIWFWLMLGLLRTASLNYENLTNK